MIPDRNRNPTNGPGGDVGTVDDAALTGVLDAMSAAIAPEETDAPVQATDELIGATVPPGSDLTGERIGLKRVSQERGETATDRLRAHPLLGTAAGELGLRTQRTLGGPPRHDTAALSQLLFEHNRV